MSRSSGKGPRNGTVPRSAAVPTRQVAPDSPEGHEEGQSARLVTDASPIRGGRNHLTNAPTVRREPPAPAPRPEHRGIMAHGVTPDQHTTRERADNMRGPNDYKPHMISTVS
jgi:hypothetical protein